jgi:predicted outer membrane repeat protein
MKRLVSLVVVLGFSCLIGGTAFGDIINVPGDQPTIQAGIDVAVPGDTVLLAPGTYAGEGNRDIDFKGKAITVKSQNGPEDCIIDCQGTETDPHRAFNFHMNESSDSVVVGLKIINGYAPTENIVMPYDSNVIGSVGGAVLLKNSNPTFTDCSFVQNYAIHKGGAMFCVYSVPILKDCNFSSNSSERGGGIENVRSNPVLTNCTFDRNAATKIGDHWGGGGIFNASSAPVLANCVFTLNSGYRGGAMHNDMYLADSGPILTNCLFLNNTAGNGSAIYNFPRGAPSVALLTNCTFVNNTGGFALYDYSNE